ncbi:MAG TPA: asparagine synthase-related protein [Candidatus Saccharimonadales bacterium]|nr:asparagine synthase-related protein [Candidatus Saccharimonadales bacterium]
MSGICGLWLRGSESELKGSIEAMVRSLGTGGRAESHVFPPAMALGVHHVPGFQGGLVERLQGKRTIALAFHGNLDEDALPSPEDAGETLLDRYLRSGIDLLRDLRGEFALAIWDSRDENLFLATDRFRVHPLLYGSDERGFAFASRMRALDRAPVPAERTIHPPAILDVVASSYVPTPETIFTEIRKLPPGHVLTCSKGRASIRPYWDIDFRNPSKASEESLAAEVREAFSGGIARRVRRDGGPERVGAFLSGGVDSSTVTGVLTQVAERPIQSFSIGFGEERFNEMSYARIAAKRYGAEHHEYFVTPRDTVEALPFIVEDFDEPFGNASAVPTYFCARMAREHGVEYLYAGDGGDELFGGNERYAFDRVFDYYRRVPGWMRAGLVTPGVRALARVIPHPFFTRARSYVTKASLPPVARMTAYSFFNIVPVAAVADPRFLATVNGYDPARAMSYHYDHALGTTDLDRQLYLDLKLAIADNDLHKVSRMTERAGVAVRYPFLDGGLAEVAARVPASMKMRGRNLRVFFKRAYAELLPPEVVAKTKHGFGLPIAIWLRTDPTLHAMMRDLVLGPQSVSRGYFQKKALERLVQEHQTDTTSFTGTVLWNLMVLELWMRRHRDGSVV